MTKIVGNPPPLGAIIRAAMLYELRALPKTDVGNAEAFALLFGNVFKYDHSRKRWMVWRGLVWTPDVDGAAHRAAIDTIRWRDTMLWIAIAEETTKECKRELIKEHYEGAQHESLRDINAILDIAKHLREIATVATDYNRNPFLLTVGNGTLDLRTGQLRNASPDDLITRATHIPYDPAAACPRWMQFQDEIFPGQPSLIEFIQRAVGYSLTGDTREQCLFILHGNGANGKSTFLEIVRMLLGPHATTTPFGTFMVQKNVGAPRNDLAALVGARLVISSEAGQDASFDEAVVKQITGQDTISCRFLYGEFFEYKPQFHIFIATNFKPAIRGNDDAIWRRLRLVPFNQQFKGDKRDSMLSEKLKAELPGILAWAVEGCLKWQRDGLSRPAEVVAATMQYREESDQVGRFLSDRCTSGPEHSVTGKALYGSYLNFCQQVREKPLANNMFAAQIAKRNFEKKRTRKGWVYQGLGLRPNGGHESDTWEGVPDV